MQEDGLATLMTQLDRGLEDAGRRRGAADVITHFCADTDLDFQEHTSDLLAVGSSGGIKPVQQGLKANWVAGWPEDLLWHEEAQRAAQVRILVLVRYVS